jgi:Fe-S-cluster containining protein
MIMELGPVRVLKPEDTFSFQCTRCGECCHDVKGAVILNSLDFFRIAKHRGQEPEFILKQFADLTLIAQQAMFPILTVRTKERAGDACWFYREGRCSIQEAKPLTCRLYPMNIQPGDGDTVDYVLVSQRQHHYTGTEVRAGDWMAENMDKEDQNFMQWWYKNTPELGKAMNSIGRSPAMKEIHKSMRSRVIQYMYLQYNTSAEFWPQFEKNIGLLIRELNEALNGKQSKKR